MFRVIIDVFVNKLVGTRPIKPQYFPPNIRKTFFKTGNKRKGLNELRRSTPVIDFSKRIRACPILN